MTDTTLAQRLRSNAESLSKTGILGQRPAILEAADELDRLTADNKALTAAKTSMETALKIKAHEIRDLKIFAKLDAEAAEAKLAKVEAELATEKEAHRLTRVAEFAKISYRDKRFAEMEAKIGCISAELAEAREVIEAFRGVVPTVMIALMATRKRDDLLLADSVHKIDDRARSFLASKESGR